MAPASAQTHAHNPASYGAYPECVSLRSRPKVPNQDPRAASGPCLLRVPALQERSPRSPVCEARRRRKDPPVLRPPTTTFRFVSAARTNIAGAKAAAAAAARKFRRFIITSSLSLAAVELPERDANRCILVRGCKPVFVLLCDAEELLHLLRSWRCGRAVRIEWPCELAEEAVEFLLAHGD